MTTRVACPHTILNASQNASSLAGPSKSGPRHFSRFAALTFFQSVQKDNFPGLSCDYLSLKLGDGDRAKTVSETRIPIDISGQKRP